jgi:hypothetical protein
MGKPRKIEESAAVYGKSASQQRRSRTPTGAESTPEFAAHEATQKFADKLFAERKELLRKLAQ